MTKNNSLKLGYDYDAWHGYGQRDVLFTDISLKTNSHMILCGMSGSGKSYALVWCLKMLILASPPEAEYFFADFKRQMCIRDSLMLGRSLGVRFICSCQRPDAKAFPDGSRLNYGIIMILGAPMRSIYEMLMPKEYIEMVEDRQFERGEGILLLQGSDLHFVKIPTVRDMEKMQEICVKALS